MRETILLVDDDQLLRQMYEQCLSSDEYEVVTAADGEACLRALEDCRPQAIVLDLVMPGGLDGFDVLRRLKDNPQWCQIPVVVFSSRGAPEDIDTALNLGATGYLVKTQTTPSDVVQKVHDVLNASAPGKPKRALPAGVKCHENSEALRLEETLLCPKCGAPMLLDLVVAGTGSPDFTGSFVCPNGCSTETV
ncbi:MAG: response regulator [Verrucomicrobia bacterium]|nr:response regulator [Verrucomicrobiota bacterium]